jgi:hypothetical protein
MAEQAAEKQLLYNLIFQSCRAGCANKTAIQVIYRKMAEQAVKKQLL